MIESDYFNYCYLKYYFYVGKQVINVMKKATYRYLLSKLTEPTALNRLKNLSEQIIDGYYVMR
jgi:hypothetical protein